ncbi:hypothetical protein [Mesorhizobium sp. 1B3]|uniref:hypothetical protein n=1 Tax=Mesorhizobium sp. 1B3 TaxID=3243599 RepID=UPI003D98C924
MFKQGDSHQLTLKWRSMFAGFAAAVMLMPAVAMQFTDEVAWGAEDFSAAAVLLGGVWLAVEFVLRFVSGAANKVIAILMIAAAVVATWAHLAVGLY